MLPTEEADRLNWREVVRAVFNLDETFHPQMGDAVHVFNTSQEYDDFVDLMEGLPFEEWDTLFYIYRAVNERRCYETLKALALYHYEPDWIFNLVRLDLIVINERLQE